MNRIDYGLDKIKEHGFEIVAVAGGVMALAAIAVIGKVGIPVTRVVETGGQVAKEVVATAPDKARYIVQMKDFNTGQWIDKTLTNSVAAAHSVAHTSTWGRASRIIDTVTGIIRDIEPGDSSLYRIYK